MSTCQAGRHCALGSCDVDHMLDAIEAPGQLEMWECGILRHEYTPAVLKDDVSNICGCRVPTLCRVPSGLSVLSKGAGVHVGSVPTALVRHHRHHATGC